MNSITKRTSTSMVQVYKVSAPSMDEAFSRLKAKYAFDNFHLKVLNVPDDHVMHNGFLLHTSKKLHFDYLNNHISEFAILGTLYNEAPKIKTDEKVIVHNVISKGTKEWETINSFRTDSNEIIFEDDCTKAESLIKAKELAIEHNKTINVVVSKRLKSHDGILGIAEVIPYKNIDTEHIYVFWKYEVVMQDEDEDTLIQENTEQDGIQYCIKEDLYSFISRKRILKDAESADIPVAH